MFLFLIYTFLLGPSSLLLLLIIIEKLKQAAKAFAHSLFEKKPALIIVNFCFYALYVILKDLTMVKYFDLNRISHPLSKPPIKDNQINLR